MPLNTSDANKVFRLSIIKGFFEPQLVHLNFKKSPIKHPDIPTIGLMRSKLLHVFFDIETGSDYPDGDEWFIADMLFPFDGEIPESLKGIDYFTTLASSSKNFWHHRELIRYKHGKSKKLEESLDFLKTKYDELYSMLKPLEKDLK